MTTAIERCHFLIQLRNGKKVVQTACLTPITTEDSSENAHLRKSKRKNAHEIKGNLVMCITLRMSGFRIDRYPLLPKKLHIKYLTSSKMYVLPTNQKKKFKYFKYFKYLTYLKYLHLEYNLYTFKRALQPQLIFSLFTLDSEQI